MNIVTIKWIIWRILKNHAKKRQAHEQDLENNHAKKRCWYQQDLENNRAKKRRRYEI